MLGSLDCSGIITCWNWNVSSMTIVRWNGQTCLHKFEFRAWRCNWNHIYKTLYWGDRTTVSNHHNTLFQFARHSTVYTEKQHSTPAHTSRSASHGIWCAVSQVSVTSIARNTVTTKQGWKLKIEEISILQLYWSNKTFCFTCLKGVLISDIKYIFVHSTVLLVSEFPSV